MTMTRDIRHILVPVDGSEGAAAAARWSRDLAAKLDGRVTLLHVHELKPAELMGMRGHAQEEMSALKAGIAREAIDRGLDIVGGSVPVAEQIVFGHPVEEILGFAARADADVIVMGRRGISKLEQLLIGSVSDGVLRHAKLPVVIVH